MHTAKLLVKFLVHLTAHQKQLLYRLSQKTQQIR